MKITEIPTSELEKILLATKRQTAPSSVEVEILRREMQRRETNQKQKADKK